MYQDLEIIDFHTHFPTSKPMFDDRGSFRDEDAPEHRKALSKKFAMKYNQDWRLAWDFPPPDREKADDKTQADRWAGEIEK